MHNNDYVHCKKDASHSNNTNCNTIVKKFHFLINEAEKLYTECDNIIDKQVLTSIWDAIKALEKAFELGNKGGEIEDYANNMFDKSGCNYTCDDNFKKCKYLADKAEEQFSIETDHLNTTLVLLKYALKEVKKSIAIRKVGYDLRSHYKKCIHYDKPNKCN